MDLMATALSATALSVAAVFMVVAGRALVRLWTLRKMVGELAAEHSHEIDSVKTAHSTSAAAPAKSDDPIVNDR